MKGKVLLIHPEVSRNKFNFAGVIENEPLELEQIATMLKDNDYIPLIWDGQLEERKIDELIKSEKPICLYVCGKTKQESFMKEYCQIAKNIDKGIITIVGGIHVQNNYARFYEDYIDYSMISFNIFNMLDILEGNKLDDVEGICINNNGEWRVNPAKPFDINKLPWADRSYFYQHRDRYRYLELTECAQIRASFSCPFRCKFCYRNTLNCATYVQRDIVDVVDEIENLDVENVYFIDDDFLYDRKRIEEFISLIKERNINKKFVCFARADFIIKNKDVVRELKEIGFYYLLVGLEAIDDKALKSYNKGSNENYNSDCIAFLNEIGINIMGMFITDLSFDKNDFKSLYAWIKKHKLKHVAISIFTPEFGIDGFDEYKDRLITTDTINWDYLHVVAKPEKLSERMYYYYYHKLLIKLFLKAYFDGIYDFVDYKYYISAFAKSLFNFAG